MRGRPATAFAYFLNGYTAMAILTAFWVMIVIAKGRILPLWTLAIPVLYLVMHTVTWNRLRRRDGAVLNPLLGETARNMLIFTLLFTLVFIIYS
jgi:1,4-dihydroxy-2-naphthoate octaprenyltransferase